MEEQETKNFFPDWIPLEERKVLRRKFRNNSAIRTMQLNLLSDKRVKRVWLKILEESNKKLREEKLIMFFSDAPEILSLGKSRKLAYSSTAKSTKEKLDDCQKLITKLKNQFIKKFEVLGLPGDMSVQTNGALGALNAWIEEKKNDMSLDRTDMAWANLHLGLEAEPLEKIKKQGSESFDETYAFVGIALLFRRIFQATHVDMIADTVMAMNDIDDDNNQKYLERAKKVIRSNLRS